MSVLGLFVFPEIDVRLFKNNMFYFLRQKKAKMLEQKYIFNFCVDDIAAM